MIKLTFIIPIFLFIHYVNTYMATAHRVKSFDKLYFFLYFGRSDFSFIQIDVSFRQMTKQRVCD